MDPPGKEQDLAPEEQRASSRPEVTAKKTKRNSEPKTKGSSHQEATEPPMPATTADARAPSILSEEIKHKERQLRANLQFDAKNNHATIVDADHRNHQIELLPAAHHGKRSDKEKITPKKSRAGAHQRRDTSNDTGHHESSLVSDVKERWTTRAATIPNDSVKGHHSESTNSSSTYLEEKMNRANRATNSASSEKHDEQSTASLQQTQRTVKPGAVAVAGIGGELPSYLSIPHGEDTAAAAVPKKKKQAAAMAFLPRAVRKPRNKAVTAVATTTTAAAAPVVNFGNSSSSSNSKDQAPPIVVVTTTMRATETTVPPTSNAMEMQHPANSLTTTAAAATKENDNYVAPKQQHQEGNATGKLATINDTTSTTVMMNTTSIDPADVYDPAVPNDLLLHWQRRNAQQERQRLQQQQAKRLQAQEELRAAAAAERQALAATGQYDKLAASLQQPQGGRGRGVSNVPAWMLKQQQQAAAASEELSSKRIKRQEKEQNV